MGTIGGTFTLLAAALIVGVPAAKGQSIEVSSGRGGLNAEYYTNITGTTLADLTNHTKFLSNTPDFIETVRSFETMRNRSDYYGARFSGWLFPPLTGTYKFYLASDDQGALFLSSDQTPAHKTVIAAEPQWNGFREYISGANQPTRGNPPTNISANIPLVSGRAYYVEGRFKEGDGGDNYSVAWLLPGAPAVTNGAAPIAGLFLDFDSPFTGDFLPLRTASLNTNGQVGVYFGHLLDPASATQVTNYQIVGATVTAATLSPDRRGVILNATGVISQSFTIRIASVKDLPGNGTPSNTELIGQILPQSSLDVGTVSDPGVRGITFSSRTGEFDVAAGGSDISGTADHFHFIQESRTGDFDVRVRVESLGAVNPSSKSGLMARETLVANSRHVSIFALPAGQTLDGQSGANLYQAFLRSSTGAPTAAWTLTGVNLNGLGFPNAWLRLRRQGNIFSAFRGVDGVNWNLIAETNQSYPSTIYLGLATTSHNNAPGYSTVAQYRSYGDFISGPPEITAQPRSFSLGVGELATLQVTAVGTSPLSFQWRKQAVPILGASSSSYSITNVQLADSGSYDVVVSSPSGSVTSLLAVLTVDLLPHITTQPQGLTVGLGSNATFQITAIGLPPLLYQWRKDGTPLSGAASTSYAVTEVQPATVGLYDVVVSNSLGSVTSAPAALSFSVPAAWFPPLQRATADTPPFLDSTAGSAIDGLPFGNGGWSGASSNSPATLVFQTETNVGFSFGTMLTFTLFQGTSFSSNQNFQLGCFRLSATTDDRSTYADGLSIGGRVVANWTVLEPFTYTAANQATLTKQPDFSLLATAGTNTIDTTYTVTAFTPLTGITGFRLEALTNATLPHNGPGRSLTGAFQLQEIKIGVQPAWTNPYPQIHVTWGLSLANPTQSAAPGTTINFSGTLNNGQGRPLAIRSVGLFFDTIPTTTNGQVAFDPVFLQTAAVIPPSGYTGPFFRVSLPADFPTSFFAGGALEMMLESEQAFGQVSPADDHPLVIQIPFTINDPPLTIERTPEGVLLSWPFAAQDYKLESTTNLTFPHAWQSPTPKLYRDYNRLTTTLPAEEQGRFFRLKLP